MADFPAISLWQPWASLWVRGPKIHETRSWRPPDRLIGERILIHAAKTKEGYDVDLPFLRLLESRFGTDWMRTLPRGAFVGSLVLQRSFRMRNGPPETDPADALCGDWSPGRYAWRGIDPRPLAAPIPARGQQGWWTAEIEGEV